MYNNDPFAPWNDPIKKNDPFAPHNNPMYANDPFKPWNSPFTNTDNLTKDEKKYYEVKDRNEDINFFRK